MTSTIENVKSYPGWYLVGLGFVMIYANLLGGFDTKAYIIIGIGILLIISGIVLMFKMIPAPKNYLPEGSSELEQAITQLNRNYEILRNQTTQGFLITIIFMILGLLVILSGSLGTLFGLSSGKENLTSVAGIILEFISGTGLLIYNQNFKRLNSISDNLNETWKILTAFKQAETLPDEKGKKTDAKIYLIQALVGGKK